VRLLELRLRGVRKRAIDLAAFAREMDGFTFADAARVCFEASKAIVLKGEKEMTTDVFEVELAEHDPGRLYARNKSLLHMTRRQMHEFASTPEQGLPKRKSLKHRLMRRGG